MKPHEEWIYKAEHDIESAEYLLTAQKPLFDVAIYHTQQCAEKGLKAYLAHHGKEIEKDHNLKKLTGKCIEIDETFRDIEDDCIFLNPYATLFRYPEGDLMPSKEDMQKAVAAARKILLFVKEKIDTAPTKNR